MPASIPGLRGSGTFTADFRPTNYRELYTLLEPNGTLLLDLKQPAGEDAEFGPLRPAQAPHAHGDALCHELLDHALRLHVGRDASGQILQLARILAWQPRRRCPEAVEQPVQARPRPSLPGARAGRLHRYGCPAVTGLGQVVGER